MQKEDKNRNLGPTGIKALKANYINNYVTECLCREVDGGLIGMPGKPH